MNKSGIINEEQLVNLVSSGELETVITAFTDHFGRLLGKRYDAEFFLESVLHHGTHACNYLLTTDMDMEPVPGFEYANWEKGYGDFHMVPDLNTLRIASWLKKTAVVICDVYDPASHQPVPFSPRNILKKQIASLRESGYQALGASELEFYLFDHSYRNIHEDGYANLKPAGWYIEDYHILQGTRHEKYMSKVRRHLKRSGIPVENSKGEWGLGQHELNVAYCDLLEMADRHVLYKQCMKEVADKMGIAVSFMAKYGTAHAGSSCHIHVSLWNDGNNAFVGNEDLTGIRCSREFMHFVGGLIERTPEVMPFYAPTINSYKRYVDASWAPTRLAWSYDNRTAGFRVVGQGNSLRIENRIPGADCNPYLAFAATLASGLHGIREKKEPPPLFEGDIYAALDLPRVAYTLTQANQRFRDSAFASESFGKDVHTHYAHFFENEIQSFNRTVTDWELRRYFERI